MGLIDLPCLLMIIGMISCEDKGFVRLVARVSEDVVLPCSLGPEVDIRSALFDWMKGRQDVFLYDAGSCRNEDPQFRGRVSHFPDKLKNGNASIIIRNLKLSDSGNYSCYFPRLQEQRFHVKLFVGASPKPRVMIYDITEDRMLLQCEVRGAFPKPQISWIDSDGTVLPATEKLEDSDGFHCPPALMLQTNVTKTGSFRCRVTQQELNHTTEVQISAHICSAYAEPRVMILKITENWALLQCEVRGAFPKPQISWIDSDETVLPATEKLEHSDGLRCTSTLTLQTNVTKHGTFHCRVTQQELNHTTEAQISIPRTYDKTVTGSDGVLLGVAIGSSTVVVLGLVVAGINWCRRRAMRERPNAINSRKDKRPVMESHDTGDSSLHPSFLLANPEEIREPKLEAEPDEALRVPLQEFQTSSNRNPNKHCQPFFQ